jgi:SAM-dependent methyltransferase
MPSRPARLLKTDMFEEAHGADQLLFELCQASDLAIGMDIDLATVQRARGRCPASAHPRLVAMDARAIGLADNSVDAVLSNSTLDHFERKEDFVQALSELARVLAPGGTLILSVDNVLNPLYWPLRWFSRTGVTFRLGYAPSPRALRGMLREAGLVERGWSSLIHNPRGVSTLLFLALRLVLRDAAEPIVRVCVNGFALLGRLPTRRYTSSFCAVLATKPLSSLRNRSA